LRTLLPQRCFTPTIRNHICAGFAFFFGRESYEFHGPSEIVFADVFIFGYFTSTWTTPGCPKIYHEHFALKIGETKVVVVEGSDATFHHARR